MLAVLQGFISGVQCALQKTYFYGFDVVVLLVANPMVEGLAVYLLCYPLHHIQLLHKVGSETFLLI
jgi:hypothetical protein